MPLLGGGVLAIWNGIAPEAEAAFVAWHMREHIPERVGLPGFLRGRRYVAIAGEAGGEPKYFNFYETNSPAALTSAAYVERLNAPTAWTREVLAQFRDTSRTVCDVVASLGSGEGGTIEAIQLREAAPGALSTMGQAMLPTLLAADGIVAVHLLRGRVEDSGGGTAEKALRGQPDAVADWILLIEAVDTEALQAARAGAGADAALMRAGAAPGPKRGIYRLQYGLTKEESA